LRGIDTNLLVRFFTEDDPGQAEQVKALFASADKRKERLYINTIVLCELFWTLRGQPYSFDRATISELGERMMETALFEIEDRDLARQAIADYRRGRADFSDYLIGRRNLSAGCDETLTFDSKLRGNSAFNALV
jgi:predicted nucleic-acid-binding protein